MSEGRNARPLLELRGVSFAYPRRGRTPEVVIAKGLDLAVRSAELLVLSGRSGAGKTTILRLGAGLLVPDAGVVRWDGHDVAALSDRERATFRRDVLGYVFQTGGLIESLTAAENVAVAAIAGRVPDAARRASEALERVGMGDRARHFPAQMSGGEQQRVAMARALFGQPKLLLVDEPTANLDRAAADQIVALCRSLVDSGVGALVASHDPAFAHVANRSIELEPDMSPAKPIDAPGHADDRQIEWSLAVPPATRRPERE